MIVKVKDAIYDERSVDHWDSISIESQIEFCKYELRGGNFRGTQARVIQTADRPKFKK